jgi:hypothetical protein
MNFEQQVSAWIENGAKTEFQRILDEHIDAATKQMREKAAQMVASLGLEIISRVSYEDNVNHIKVELSIPKIAAAEVEDGGVVAK